MSSQTEVLRRGPSDWQIRSFTPIFHDHAVKVATASALRTRSFAYRHYLAKLATHGELDYAEVHKGVEPSHWEPRWLVGLARVVAFQDLEPDDRAVGTRLFEQAVRLLTPEDAAGHVEELVRLLISQSRWKEAWDLVHGSPALLEQDHGYLLADLLNPASGSPFADLEKWTRQFGKFFSLAGLGTPFLADGPGHAFDLLRCEPASDPFEDGPLVSVVMTTFKAEPAELRTSVQSILHQTYRNLEVILVDDCSPEDHVPALEEIADLDPRIRLVRLEKNGGTYLARNAGMRLARGEIVTGQDADDWSHPERIARQVRPMLEDEGLAGTRCRAVTTNENLVVTRPGYLPTRPNPSSLMFRRDMGLELGGFLPARKGADSEFHARLNAVGNRPVLDLEDAPLTVVRIRSDSLSRSDFKPGWSHGARRTFVDAYRHWHMTAPPAQLSSDHAAGATVAIPWAFQVDRPNPRQFDVVVVADFRPRTLRSRSIAHEIRTLVEAGLQVAVLQIEDLRHQTARKDALEPALLELINAGHVARISEDEPHAARLVLVRSSATLAAPPGVPVALRAERLAVVADRLTWDPADGVDALASEAAAATALFGLAPIWVAPDARARRVLQEAVPGAFLAQELLPETVDPARWYGPRRTPRAGMPVIGRAGVDTASLWPDSLEEISAAFPTDFSADVRVLGGRRGMRLVEGLSHAARSWVTFSHEETDLETFLGSVDFLVHASSTHAPALTALPVVEALASGCVVILPEALAAPFGDAVVVAGPEGPAHEVRRLHRKPSAFAEQSRRGVELVRRTHHSSLAVELVNSLLS